jgi:hypothetical protein
MPFQHCLLPVTELCHRDVLSIGPCLRRPLDARDDLDAPLAQDAEVAVVAAGGRYFTVVGMLVIFPLMI